MDLAIIKGSEKEFEGIRHKLSTEVEFVVKDKSSKNTVEVYRGLKRYILSLDLRWCLENATCDAVFNFEPMARDSLHYRRSGLNHVLCVIARKKSVAIGFNVGRLLHLKQIERAHILGKMRQNVVLCRKYGVAMRVATFGTTPYDLRADRELIALGMLLGMTFVEARSAIRH